ncbi:mitochondrial 54S ribosomal protein bL21m [Aspergillus ibericus CBS 121593]|uniref:Large ribosomal subunit protein bL21m n=1 Tax=Aspergillus ibericus CBS 121593 TaxID=1448316 RepID=A0A395H5I9_9EURO|nr:aconitate hydratase [Aspergillus ibericus CBS 121593]RAL02960.1 aconitate hydratase [Aspergillus ibericus CBS 121593]
MFSRTTLARALALPIEHSSARSASTTFRACLHQATSTTTTTTSQPEAPLSATPRAQTSIPIQQPRFLTSSNSIPQTRADVPLNKQPVAPTFDAPLKVSQSLLELLPNLTSQKPHFITAHLHDRPYLLTAGDQLRLPFLMPKVKSGDILRFNRASVLGSRDFTLKGGAQYLDERLFECRVRVMGFESEPLRITEKTKRRRRHVQKVTSKHRYTILRVMDVKVKTAEELLEEGAVVVESADSAANVELKA